MTTPKFEDFGLDPRVLKTLEGLGFETPTPIQAEAIPPLLAGRDVIGRARTGSGKTAAFGLPIVELVRESSGPRRVRVLILAPTRELAMQVTEALRSFARGLPIRIVTVYGGASYRPQFDALSAGVPVVVGTPGRLIDHLERGSLDLSGAEMVIIDEADEMLRMGFIDDVERLLGATPEGRQVALFSATMPPPIRRVADRYLNNPLTLEVEATKGPTTEHIQQRFLRVPDRYKLDALCRVLQGERRDAALVFVRTRKDAGSLAEALAGKGIAADALHGDLGQSAREQVLRRLRAGQIDCVVATDVAARGIDVQHISHVINVDIPEQADSYTHRIGRTGRAGREGQAISFVTPKQMRHFQMIRQRVGARIPEASPPSDAEIARRQRASLWEDVEALADQPAHAQALHWVDELTATSDWSPHDIAAAALATLAEQRGLSLKANLDDRPPLWSQPPSARSDRDGRGGRKDRPGRPERGQQTRGGGGTPEGPGGAGGAGGPGPGPRDRNASEEMVELFLPIGSRNGVGPGDLVGALTNELSVPGSAIGRITIAERKAFVSVTKEVATRLLADSPTLQIRGKAAKISQARTPSAPAGPRGPGGPKPWGKGGDKAKGWAKPKGKGKAKSKANPKNKGKKKPKPEAKPEAKPEGEA